MWLHLLGAERLATLEAPSGATLRQAWGLRLPRWPGATLCSRSRQAPVQIKPS